MNLILLFPSELDPLTQRVRLTGRRHQHVLEILKPKVNDALCIGVENGRIGTGRVVSLDDNSVELELDLTADPPEKLPVTLCLALMRPIVLKRVLQIAASMGVKRIVLFHSRRVEKSFWQSTALQEEAIREQFILGLEQARDTVLPEISLQKRFKPFVEDVLPELLEGRGPVNISDLDEVSSGRRPDGKRKDGRKTGRNAVGLVADPSGDDLSSIFHLSSSFASEPKVLILGPEGGFIPYELEMFKDAGCRVVGLGERILKVETAVVALLARIF